MNMRKLARVLRGVFLSLFVIFSVQQTWASVEMPVFALKSVHDGKTIESEEFKGNALLVTFFATWCPSCIEEIPTLIKLQNQFAQQGFSVIGLSVDQGGTDAVQRLVKKKDINYPVVMADAKTIRDFGGVYAIPVSFLVNKGGNVVKKYPGLVPPSVLASDIQSILK